MIKRPLPPNSVKINTSIAPEKLDAEHKAMDPRSHAGCLPIVMKTWILNPPQTRQRSTWVFYISGKNLNELGKQAGKVFYFKGMLCFFLWKDGQSKMMLTLLVKKWKGLILFYYVRIKCYRISNSFCIPITLIVTSKTNLEKNP